MWLARPNPGRTKNLGVDAIASPLFMCVCVCVCVIGVWRAAPPLGLLFFRFLFCGWLFVRLFGRDSLQRALVYIGKNVFKDERAVDRTGSLMRRVDILNCGVL